ncbi:DUF4250 domain-containing protein [Aliagarivorans taiwanensis]|uniref:DUF4250 domain-containing protein n=1 Tax=Aliagarivorans taiwanensis TaxID=561966 RepID=UPI00042853FC|nr:DUF4250 domain-containing protein [Aliagarivorans taiwanensis]
MFENWQTMDINMLVSILNMQLRNLDNDYHQLCSRFEMDESGLKERLNDAGFYYHAQINQWR